jgi:hypothetical protein
MQETNNKPLPERPGENPWQICHSWHADNPALSANDMPVSELHLTAGSNTFSYSVQPE